MATHQEMIGGMKMPSVGLGTFRATNEEQLTTALNKALELGYRHIDTAYIYQNESVIGKVLKEWFSSGKLKRSDLFITTKLPSQAVQADLVETFLKKSLTALELDYVDLYLIHTPILRRKDDSTGDFVTCETDHIAVWKKMEEQVDAGRVKCIGLSNFNIRQIEKVWNSSRIKPSCLQVELQPYMQQPELVDFCHKKNIVVVGYSTLGSGGSAGPSPPSMPNIKLPNILGDETIQKIATKHGRTPAQIILRYFVQKNIVMIPKSVTPNRLKENFDLFSFSLDENDLNNFKSLDKGEAGRLMDPARLNPKLREHPEYPFGK